ACRANPARDAARRATWQNVATTRRESASSNRWPVVRTARGSVAEVAAQNWRVGINSPVSQERPVPAGFLDHLRVARRHHYRGVGSGFSENPAEWVGDEG